MEFITKHDASYLVEKGHPHFFSVLQKYLLQLYCHEWTSANLMLCFPLQAVMTGVIFVPCIVGTPDFHNNIFIPITAESSSPLQYFKFFCLLGFCLINVESPKFILKQSKNTFQVFPIKLTFPYT